MNAKCCSRGFRRKTRPYLYQRFNNPPLFVSAVPYIRYRGNRPFSAKIPFPSSTHRHVREILSLYLIKANRIPRRSCGSNPFPAGKQSLGIPGIQGFFCAFSYLFRFRKQPTSKKNMKSGTSRSICNSVSRPYCSYFFNNIIYIQHLDCHPR